MEANCSHSNLLVQNFSNFKKSGPPARIMYYENGSWCDFDAGVADTLRIGFSGGVAVVEAAVDGVRCLVDFYRMVQIRLDGGDQRSVAWIDVNGNCFFPKCSIDSDGAFNVVFNSEENEIECLGINGNREVNGNEIESPKVGGNGEFKAAEVKIEHLNVDVDGAVNAGNEIESPKVRLVEKLLEGSSSNFELARWSRVRVLSETETAYSTVKKLFLSGVRVSDPGVTLTSIHQVVRSRPLDQARFEVFQKQMEVMKVYGGGANTTYGWHGASEKGVEVILNHGFSEVSKCGGYGVGVYFSPVANASAMLSEGDSNGEKHVILCRVLLGKCEKVEAGSQQMYPSSVEFDTGVDNLKNPKWFVVWGANVNTHIIPRFVVSYRPSNSSLGQLRGPQIVRSLPEMCPLVVEKLISKLSASLPSSRVQEIQGLCSAYKEGKMAKHSFLKHLRSIAGNERLLWAFRELRSSLNDTG